MQESKNSLMLAGWAPPDQFKQRPSIRRYWTGRLRIGSLPWCLTPQPPTWERTKAQKSISTNSLVFPLLSRLQTPCQWVAGQEPIQFYKNHIQYKQVDKVFADSALKTLSRHFGYLVPDTVIYSLFSDLVTEDKKSGIAAKLLTFPREEKDVTASMFPEIISTISPYLLPSWIRTRISSKPKSLWRLSLLSMILQSKE